MDLCINIEIHSKVVQTIVISIGTLPHFKQQMGYACLSMVLCRRRYIVGKFSFKFI